MIINKLKRQRHIKKALNIDPKSAFFIADNIGLCYYKQSNNTQFPILKPPLISPNSNNGKSQYFRNVVLFIKDKEMATFKFGKGQKHEMPKKF
jgi:hypothetical protein